VASRSLAQEHQHGTGEKLGAVHFSTSCNGSAQKDINRAVALLHSFQFSRAIDDFKVALGKDATCTIAYWGIALSDWGNPFAPGIIDKRLLQLGRESAERGEMLGAKTERERAYLAAVRICTETSKVRRSKRACSPIAMPWETWRRNIRKITRRRFSTHWRSPSPQIPGCRPSKLSGASLRPWA
jgi:hypothetical protein